LRRVTSPGTLGDCAFIGVVPTTDLERARRFYGEVLGLRVTGESPIAVVLESAGGMIRVTLVDDLVAAHYTVLGWKVDDIDHAVRLLAARGVPFERYSGLEQDRHGVWTTPGGDRVAWFKDPDENILSLTQFRPD
jgi:catechol 2,3-dioxygenase-like lactoylglutathione lyase family enzyme